MLYSRLRSIIRINDLTESTFVEPYAGGAGAALGLLVSGQVSRIAINDLDPAIFAFWKAVTEHPQEFTHLVNSVPLVVDEWETQRERYLTSSREDYLALGFATFYLNRTNRSGILNGGPIGGKDQKGNYKIDARFNRETLAERIRLIALHAGRIEVTNDDGLVVIDRHACNPESLIYADPPYFEKAGSLYLNAFNMEGHELLASHLNQASAAKWVLTYDDVSHVHRLYEDRRRMLFTLNYSAHRVTKAQELMVFSDSLTIPDEIKDGNQLLLAA